MDAGIFIRFFCSVLGVSFLFCATFSYLSTDLRNPQQQQQQQQVGFPLCEPAGKIKMEQEVRGHGRVSLPKHNVHKSCKVFSYVLLSRFLGFVFLKRHLMAAAVIVPAATRERHDI